MFKQLIPDCNQTDLNPWRFQKVISTERMHINELHVGKLGIFSLRWGSSLDRDSYRTQIASPFYIIPFQTSLIRVAEVDERLAHAAQWLLWVSPCIPGYSTVLHSNMTTVPTQFSVNVLPSEYVGVPFDMYSANNNVTHNSDFVTRKVIKFLN